MKRHGIAYLILEVDHIKVVKAVDLPQHFLHRLAAFLHNSREYKTIKTNSHHPTKYNTNNIALRAAQLYIIISNRLLNATNDI